MGSRGKGGEDWGRERRRKGKNKEVVEKESGRIRKGEKKKREEGGRGRRRRKGGEDRGR